MKKTFVIIAAVVIASSFGLAAETDPAGPFDLQVQSLYSAPDENANLIFTIPINVKLLDVSEDANWYKVRISYAFGPLSYTYVGWAKIPVGDILAEREKRPQNSANLP